MLITSFVLSALCPDLAGNYGCTLQQAGQASYSVLKIEQKLLSDVAAPELEQYSFDYTDIQGPADVIRASKKGETDAYGWTTRCEENHLISYSPQVGSTTEIYLNRETDQSLSLVQTFDGKVVLSCPKL